MAWHAIYETESGRLVSVGQVVADPLPDGLTDLGLTERPPDGQMWEAATRAFVPRPPKVVIDRLDDLQTHPSFADLRQAISALTPAQRTALRNALGRLLSRFRFRAASEAAEVL